MTLLEGCTDRKSACASGGTLDRAKGKKPHTVALVLVPAEVRH